MRLTTITNRWPVLAAMIAVSFSAFGHGGGLDDRGCHNDSNAGNYHCHQGKSAGKTFDSEAALQAGQSGDQGRTSSSSEGYDRDSYHSSWRDRDGDCQDTREEVLIEESTVPVEFKSSRECDVVAGRWKDPYSGEVFTDPSDLDIDHLVPLKEAHESGAADWPQSRKHRYANDLQYANTLIAVEAGENRSKGAGDPGEWMPSSEGFHCEYVEHWVSVKERWGLELDSKETLAIVSFKSRCR